MRWLFLSLSFVFVFVLFDVMVSFLGASLLVFGLWLFVCVLFAYACLVVFVLACCCWF